MRALVYDGQLKVTGDYVAPKAGPDEVVIRTVLAGICQTDIEITRGYMGFRGVLGHEFVGVVESAGGASGEKWKGRRVVGDINCVCGKCEMCMAGLKGHCLRRTVLGIDGRGGCMAERFVLPAANLYAVPDSVPDRVAVLTEPLAAAFQVIQQVPPNPRTKAVLIGDGRLGQLIAQVLTSRGMRPLVIGRHEGKLRRLDRLGISCLAASEARPRHDAHLVIDASGSADGLRLAMEFVRPRGMIVLKSTVAGGCDVNLSPLVVNEVTMVGSRCGPIGDALAALAQREIDTEGMITAEVPLKDGVRGVSLAQEPEALKVVVRIE